MSERVAWPQTRRWVYHYGAWWVSQKVSYTFQIINRKMKWNWNDLFCRNSWNSQRSYCYVRFPIHPPYASRTAEKTHCMFRRIFWSIFERTIQTVNIILPLNCVKMVHLVLYNLAFTFSKKESEEVRLEKQARQLMVNDFPIQEICKSLCKRSLLPAVMNWGAILFKIIFERRSSNMEGET